MRLTSLSNDARYRKAKKSLKKGKEIAQDPMKNSKLSNKKGAMESS